MSIENEQTSFTLTMRPLNNGASYTPATARYKIHCVTNNRSIRSWTSLTASDEMSVLVTPDDNVILTNSNRTERRQLQVQTDFDTDNQKVSVFEWDVRNLAD